MNEYFTQHPNLIPVRYNSWYTASKLSGLTVLDLGCEYADAGKYVLENGASRYVGVDINLNNIELADTNLNQSFPNSNYLLIHSSIDEFLKNNIEKFDVVFVGVLIHGMGDVIEFFKKLANIASTVVIESAHPFYPMYKHGTLSDIELHDLEYNTSVVESYEENLNKCVQFLHSIGYLKTIFNRLGFVENLESYENLKKEIPQVYGFNLTSRLDTPKQHQHVIVFHRQTTNKHPITWNDQFDDI